MSTKQITINTLIEGPPKKIWNLYVQPEHITQWNFADASWHCPTAENDLREGGTYKARMEAKDGSFGFDFTATYTQVIPHEQLSYSLEDGRQVSIEFEDKGDFTKVIISFDPESQNPREMQRDGWKAILSNFKAYAESN